ncbi:MAG: 16S rRNA (cytosine(1402)-N(4))-methyltransferase RsmH [Cyclobacteriaceae bacterium]|nr:16S rRNA (cytosine(1402)-N(4))-methyltransferase RsmH [Cyclobacteriaceae bacterium]
MDYHIPVLLDECIRGLNIDPDGVYVDATFGGGGHSRVILEKLDNGRMFAFDQDEDAETNARDIIDPRFRFISGNFRHIKKYLKLYEVKKIDGLIADLGVSSHQIDQPERGFSTRFEGNLDMRMDNTIDITAGNIINTYSQENLQRIFSEYGEVRNARTLAQVIVRERIRGKILTTQDFTGILEKLVPGHKRFKYFAQVFQALRIEVNDEINALKELLMQSAGMLKTGGRLVILSYHSLEDRLVKNYLLKGNFEGTEQKDIYGHSDNPFMAINRKPMMASPGELERNPRAKSARLRIAEKT